MERQTQTNASLRHVELLPVLQQRGTALNSTVRMVAAAMDGNTIRAAYSARPEMASMGLRAELENTAFAYTGMKINPDDPIFDEMLAFVLKSFGHFGMHEIREAFRLAADGTTGAGADLKAYFGNWSVSSLGAILQAYEAHRKTIIAKFQQVESEARVLALPVQAKKTTEEYESERVERLKSDPAAIVTVNDFSILRKKNLLSIEKEDWKKLLERAVNRIKIESLAIVNGGGGIGERVAARADLVQLEGEIKPDLWARVQAEAKRLAVMDWIGDPAF